MKTKNSIVQVEYKIQHVFSIQIIVIVLLVCHFYLLTCYIMKGFTCYLIKGEKYG